MHNNSTLFVDEAAYYNASTYAKFLGNIFKQTHPGNYLEFMLVCYGYATAAFTMLEDYNNVEKRNHEHFWLCFGVTLSNIINPDEFDLHLASVMQSFFLDYKESHPSTYSTTDLYMFQLGYVLYSDQRYQERVLSHLRTCR